MIQAALEASTRAASVALAVEGQVEGVHLDGSAAHASDLVPALERLCSARGVDPADLQLLAIGIGPGSFTGLRVAISTALGLTRATGAQLVGVSSHAAAAWRVFEAEEAGSRITVLQDARGGCVQTSSWQRSADAVQCIAEHALVPCAEAAQQLAGSARLLADEAGLRAARLAPDDPRVVASPAPDAEAVLTLGARQLEAEGPTPAEALRPLYLRPFVPGLRPR